MILLDTSVAIEIVEGGAGFAQCVEQLQRFPSNDIHISALTIFEVEAGLFDGSRNITARRARWNQFVDMMILEVVFDAIASEGARIVRQTAKAGKQLGSFDAMIAATALEFDLTLATRDRDFERVAGLKLEVWR